MLRYRSGSRYSVQTQALRVLSPLTSSRTAERSSSKTLLLRRQTRAQMFWLLRGNCSPSQRQTEPHHLYSVELLSIEVLLNRWDWK